MSNEISYEKAEENRKKYYKALGMESYDNLVVAACHPFFVEEAMDLMDEDPDEDEYYHYPYFDFIFTDFAKRPGDLIDNGEVEDLPYCHFDSFEELSDFNLEENAMIFTRKNYYHDDEDDDEKPYLKQFNEDFGTNFTSFAECWDWVLDEEKSGQNFVVNVFKNGEML